MADIRRQKARQGISGTNNTHTMKHAFTTMRLEAPSLYQLIMKWVEMQLIVTENGARIIGDGYYYEIAGAFSDLVLDWEATIHLPHPGLEPGAYELNTVDDRLYAFRDQQRYPIPDGPVEVVVAYAPEED